MTHTRTPFVQLLDGDVLIGVRHEADDVGIAGGHVRAEQLRLTRGEALHLAALLDDALEPEPADALEPEPADAELITLDSYALNLRPAADEYPATNFGCTFITDADLGTTCSTNAPWLYDENRNGTIGWRGGALCDTHARQAQGHDAS